MDGRTVEGVVQSADATGIRYIPPGHPDPIFLPAPELTVVEVYQTPPTRMDYYMGVGALLGLGLGLLTSLDAIDADPCGGAGDFDCDPQAWRAQDDGTLRVIALTVVGAGVGAIVGRAAEGEGVWQPLAIRWSPESKQAQVQLALSF